MKTLASYSGYFGSAPSCEARHWWLFPHYLGLDAVAVALVWQVSIAHLLRVKLEWYEAVALGLCVFSIYLGDRLRDSYCLSDRASPRHRFVFQHRRTLAGIFILSLAAGAGVAAVFLSRAVLTMGVLLCPVVLLYFVWTHVRGVFSEFGWQKESVVGIVFSAGVFLAPALKSGEMNPSILAMAVAFGILCILNCLTISYHESRGHRTGIYWIAAALAIVMQSLLWVATSGHADFFAPIVLGSVGLMALMRARDAVRSDCVAALADMVLVLAGLLTWVL